MIPAGMVKEVVHWLLFIGSVCSVCCADRRWCGDKVESNQQDACDTEYAQEMIFLDLK